MPILLLRLSGLHVNVRLYFPPPANQQLLKKKVTAADIGSILLGEITGTPLSAATLATYKAPGASLPLGMYFGTTYDSNPKLTVSYTPAQLQNHYSLTPLIKQGCDGSGQTIALVEAYGYAAAETDVNAAAKVFDLPALTSKTFSVSYPEGEPVNSNAADLTGWTTEIALDIQSSHAIAPGAKIVVVASAGQDNENQIASLQYIISHKLANTVSSSWENDSEIIAGPDEENAFNTVLERGAASGSGCIVCSSLRAADADRIPQCSLAYRRERGNCHQLWH